jgi:diguanylate cyclase (GGDEF)-like protein
MHLYRHQISEKISERVGNVMIRRLVKRWHDQKPSGASLPPVTAFAAEEIAWCWDSVMLLQQLPDGDFRYLHYGDTVADAAGFNLQGKCVSHFRSRIGAFFWEKYNLCLSMQTPLYTIHRADLAPTVQSWERLLLPLISEQGGMHILALNQPLEFKHDMLDSILRASMDGILHLQAMRDEAGEIVDFLITVLNPAAERIAALPAAKLIDHRLSELPPNNLLHAIDPACRQVLKVGRSVVVELTDPRPGRYAVFTVNAVRTGDGATVTLTNISSHKRQEQELRQALTALETEMGERKNLQDELTRMATTDSLTGALNRRELMRRAKREVATARRYGRPLSLLIADIDFFKKVNDTYGHGVGDVAIRMVADICAQTLRESDLVARIGGEEFVILMPETTGESACSTAERLRKAIAAIEISADERSFSITVSLGVTEWSPEDENVEATLARADGALYEGKQGGRNRVVMHMPQVIHTTGHQDASTPGDRLPVAASTIRH